LELKDLIIYGVFMLIPFITFPFILITAERQHRDNAEGS
jgi:hypothetical protein